MAATGARANSKNLVLAAMIFAVAMTFIDQTIVSIAVPEIQKELGLTSTGVQWAVNAYLLSLAALFAWAAGWPTRSATAGWWCWGSSCSQGHRPCAAPPLREPGPRRGS